MAACKRKTFGNEWEAKGYIQDNPWPEPSPEVFAFNCPHCGKFHVSDKPPRRGKRGGRKRRR